MVTFRLVPVLLLVSTATSFANRAVWREHAHHAKTLKVWGQRLNTAARKTFLAHTKLNPKDLKTYVKALKDYRKDLVKQLRKSPQSESHVSQNIISDIDRVVNGVGSWAVRPKDKGASRAEAIAIALRLEKENNIKAKLPGSWAALEPTADQRELLTAINDLSRLRGMSSHGVTNRVIGLTCKWGATPFLVGTTAHAMLTSPSEAITTFVFGALLTTGSVLSSKHLTKSGTQEMRAANKIHHEAINEWKTDNVERLEPLKRLGVTLQ